MARRSAACWSTRLAVRRPRVPGCRGAGRARIAGVRSGRLKRTWPEPDEGARRPPRRSIPGDRCTQAAISRDTPRSRPWHGVKGAEFDKACSWSSAEAGTATTCSQMLELAADPRPYPPTDSDAFERNRNLFYVSTCSRPKKRRAVFFTQRAFRCRTTDGERLVEAPTPSKPLTSTTDSRPAFSSRRQPPAYRQRPFRASIHGLRHLCASYANILLILWNIYILSLVPSSK